MATTPAGQFPHRVSVMQTTRLNDGGVPVPTEPTVLYDRLPASVRTASEARMVQVFASQVTAQASHVVKVRHALSLVVTNSSQHLLWHDVNGSGVEIDRPLRILGVADPDGRRVELVIACSETRA